MCDLKDRRFGVVIDRDYLLAIGHSCLVLDGTAYSDSDLYDLLGTYGGPRDTFFVLVNNGEVIGTAGIKEDSKNTALLRRLFVETKERKKGYGTLLVDEALKFCKSKDYKTIVFRTTNRMVQAIEFCKKRGFKKAQEAELQGFYIYKFVKELVK